MSNLVIQLLRFGDVLLMLPFLRSLKNQYPDAPIDCMVDERYVEWVQRSGVVRDVIGIPLRQWIRDVRDPTCPVQDVVTTLMGVVSCLRHTKYRRVFQFDYHDFPSRLAGSVNADEVTGWYINGSGNRHVSGESICYLAAMSGLYQENRCHLVDLQLLLVPKRYRLRDSRLQLPTGDIQWAKDRLFTLGQGKKIIICHLTASERTKTLGPKVMRNVVQRLQVSTRLTWVVTGSKQDQSYARELTAGFSDEIVNLVGKTTLTQLGALFLEADHLVTSDSGPMHLATALGKRVTTISVGRSAFGLFGPFGEGQSVIRAKAPIEKIDENGYLDVVNAEMVEELAEIVRRELWDESSNGGKFWQTYRTGFDRKGYWMLSPSAGVELDPLEVERSAIRDALLEQFESGQVPVTSEPLVPGVEHPLADLAGVFHRLSGACADLLVSPSVIVMKEVQQLMDRLQHWALTPSQLLAALFLLKIDLVTAIGPTKNLQHAEKLASSYAQLCRFALDRYNNALSQLTISSAVDGSR